MTDLRGLAIERDSAQPTIRTRPNVATRYVLPALLLFGFLSLLVWAARDLVLPPTRVTVIPVFSTTAEVLSEGTPLFQAAGWIEPRPTPMRVAALAPGVVESLLVVEDQAVKSGDPIAELVKDDAKLERDRALADLELREAELEETKATLVAAETRLEQPVHLEATLNDAEASLAKIDTELKNLPFELRRAKATYEAMRLDHEGKSSANGVVARAEIDIARSKSDAANALVEELHDREESLKKEQMALGNRRDALQTQLELLTDETKARAAAEAQVRAAKARVSQARVVLAEADLRLKRMTIVAPVDGRVFRLIAHPGARIGSGMTQMDGHDGSTVITMYRPSMLQVRVDTRFEDIPKVSLGQAVAIDNPAVETPLTGKVLFISSEADIQKNTLQVKVAIPNPPEVLKPEMLVDVTFLSPASPEPDRESEVATRIFVPRQLVVGDEGSKFVWLADQSERVAIRQQVEIGARTQGDLIEITNGLNVASRLISSGREQIADGDRILVTGEDHDLGRIVGSTKENTGS